MIEKKIKKYEILLANLKENEANNNPYDYYPYDMHIKITKQFIKDLKACLTERNY